MTSNKKTLKSVSVIIILVVIWCVITVIDYRRVCHSFEKPIFSIGTETQDDGGSGIYKGLGYSFDIKGNFMPEDELQGVTNAKFYLFGNMLKESVRD